MKEEIFKRVVKWKKEPDEPLLYMGLFFVIVSLIGLKIWNDWAGFVFTFFLTGIGWFMVFFGLGKDKKVYWRKIK